ncbi:MAG TPA: hypothetical protein PLS96_12180, partial [Myxococcota bacterium]|nr:hypothetical protein [Myxococcota bacterium]
SHTFPFSVSCSVVMVAAPSRYLPILYSRQFRRAALLKSTIADMDSLVLYTCSKIHAAGSLVLCT